MPKEFITKVYFTQHLVGLNDSLSFRNKLYLSQNSIDKLNDIEFKNLAVQLISNKSKSIKLDMSLIQNVGLNKLIGVDINQKINTEIGESIISYSRIIYDDKKENACFYFENKCSGLCGFGLFVFVEKVNGVWTIKKEIQHWVS